MRVRFADLRAVTRSITLGSPILATTVLAEIAVELVRAALADHPGEKTITLLAISASQLREDAVLQLELPLGLADEGQRPGSRKGLARGRTDRALDAVRAKLGENAVAYASTSLSTARSVPDEFRRLAEKGL